jgi:hypothetical protein
MQPGQSGTRRGEALIAGADDDDPPQSCCRLGPAKRGTTMMYNGMMRAAAALLLATTAIGSAHAYTIASPGSVVAGKTIADWGVEWWKWALFAPAGSSGLEDTTGALTQLDNNRAVFFIGGGANGFGPATSIDVTVPLGRPILLRLVNLIDFESASFYDAGTPVADRQAVAIATADGYEASVAPSALSAIIDGDVVANPYQYLEREPGLFSFGTVAAGTFADALGFAAGTDLDTGVATGWYLMLNGLSLGSHVLNLSGSTTPFDVTAADGTVFSYPGFSVDQTIRLNVAAVPEPTSWALLLTGFGLTGAVMRRRNTKVVVA